MLGVLVFDTLPGLFIGIVVSLLLLLYRASRPHVASSAGCPARRTSTATSSVIRRTTPVPGIAVLRPESGLFFANADRVRGAIRSVSCSTSSRICCAVA